jgi:hypothetical protein
MMDDSTRKFSVRAIVATLCVAALAAVGSVVFHTTPPQETVLIATNLISLLGGMLVSTREGRPQPPQ